MAPGQLPFPLMYDPPSLLLYTSGRPRFAYECQRDSLPGGGGGTKSSKKEDNKAAVGGAGGTATAANNNNNALQDPPPVTPFLNLRTAIAEERAFKRDLWTLLQHPNLIPILDKLSSISGSVKAQQNPNEVVSLDVKGGGILAGGGARKMQ